ncbi:hypothetical protein NDR87_26170 [Nocardia sp. CDC159]|uniref:Uncharacterized protein n=1 Tax=Nocardia pulmonis TaxID=2951408 RepID=A0A9X2E885_9NOCA|nr:MULTISPECIES: hypothetical protein [Nocardia]MCM6774933.1 hypothetical protein [Nocardia pulmonis]MCM6789864.1 hypothetical protein [Nocardia sp. CDC159]
MLTPNRLCSSSLALLVGAWVLYGTGVIVSDLFLGTAAVALTVGAVGTEWALLVWLQARRKLARRYRNGPYLVPIPESPSSRTLLARKARPVADALPPAAATGHPRTPAHAGGGPRGYIRVRPKPRRVPSPQGYHGAGERPSGFAPRPLRRTR